MLGIISSFLEDRYQRVTLDGETSDWAEVEAGVPQGSILGPLFFLIYINDLFDTVSSDIRIFADDTFIFKVINCQESHQDLDSDLQNITKWAEQWKMSFNPDITKPAHDVTFSSKRNPQLGVPLSFNNIPIKVTKKSNHLGMLLDHMLEFDNHVKEKISKARSILGIMHQVKNYVSHLDLQTFYKSYSRPNFD